MTRVTVLQLQEVAARSGGCTLRDVVLRETMLMEGVHREVARGGGKAGLVGCIAAWEARQKLWRSAA